MKYTWDRVDKEPREILIVIVEMHAKVLVCIYILKNTAQLIIGKVYSL